MGRKRKTLANADISSSPKATSKPRTIQETSSQQESFVDLPYEDAEGSDQEYPIKCILDESRGKYLIAWEGPYTPTWVSLKGGERTYTVISSKSIFWQHAAGRAWM
jgi:hypothetical protein